MLDRDLKYPDQMPPRPIEMWRRSGFAGRESPVCAHEVDLLPEVASIVRACRRVALKYHSRTARKRIPESLGRWNYRELYRRYPVRRTKWHKRSAAPGFVYLWNLPWGDRGAAAVAIVGELRKLTHGATEAIAARVSGDAGWWNPSDQELVLAVSHLQETWPEVIQLLSNLEAEVLRELGPDEPARAIVDDAETRLTSWTLGANRRYYKKPKADEKTFVVHFGYQSSFLGPTKPFRLFARLSRRPNTFIENVKLMEAAWEGKVPKKNALQGQITILREKLSAAGMDLIIDGREGYYAMLLP